MGDKLLTVGGEAGGDVGHGLHLKVHGEMQLLKDLLLPPHGSCPLFVIEFMLLGAGLEPLNASVVNPDHVHALRSLGVNDPVVH